MRFPVNNFCRTFCTLVAFKRPLKIDCENAFQQEKQEPWLNCNPGLVLTGLRTTGPRAYAEFLYTIAGLSL